MSASDPSDQTKEIRKQHIEQPQEDAHYDDDDEHCECCLRRFSSARPDNFADFDTRIPEKIYGAPPQISLVHDEGCKACNNSGYRGRTGIYELILVDDQLRNLIHEGAAEQELTQYARQHSQGIGEHGRERVLAGETSIEEVMRVTSAS